MTEDPLAIARQLGEALASVGSNWALGGSMASSAHGVPRSTQDLDVVVQLPARSVAAFARAAKGFLIDEDTLRAQLRAGRAYNLFHGSTVTKVDLFPAVGAFERNQLERAELRSGIPFVSAEDAILAKLRWFRLGGELSERQWSDVRGVVEIQGARLDRQHLETWARTLGVEDLLARALERGVDR